MRLLFLKDFLDLVFPRNCSLCSRSLFDFENCLCTICKGNLPVANFHLRPEDNELTSKLKGLTQIGMAMAFIRFTKKGKSQKILHTLKYRNNPELAQELGRLYGNVLAEYGFSSQWHHIVPVPLHPLKLRRRGYNQSEQFGLGLSSVLNIPLQNVLSRKKFTDTQTNKSRLERMENVDMVFEINPGINTEGKSILLVDDVITTGATLCSCANVLLANGAKNVDLATIAAGGK
jgi:ComF family protein